MACSSLSGPAGSLNAGFAFGIALIYKFGSTKLQKRFLPDLLTGKKRGCVAITEPEAGSDVANFTTTAVESDDGQHYILNGSKKWFLVRLCYLGRANRWTRSRGSFCFSCTSERPSWCLNAPTQSLWSYHRRDHIH